jgi:ATP-dependent Clp protease ATP-binding subunit ClpB
VRRRPYSVILLDEIEKAHSDVFNVLLQVLDDGRMTDGKGRTVDFKNTILIMTSNLGGDLIIKMVEENAGHEAISHQIAEILRLKFKPEFLNRIDETIIFSSLSKEHMLAIIDIQLQRVLTRVAERKIKVKISQAAKEFLVNSGYNPQFGARPLKRAIQRHLEDPLALELLEGHFSEGDTINIDAAEGKLTFSAV